MKADSLCKTIDTLNRRIASVICFAFLFIMLIQVMEATLRYVFNSPTIWAWDINGQAFSATAILAGAYVYLQDSHVRMDILYSRGSARKRLVFDLIGFPFLLLIFALIVWQGGKMALWAYQHNQRATSYFAPILWPVKLALPLAGFLMLLQAMSKFIRAVDSVRKPNAKEAPESL